MPSPLMPLEEARKLIVSGCENWPRLVEAVGTICDARESTVTDLVACLNHRGLPREFAAMALSKRTCRLEEPLSLDPDEWRSYLTSRSLLPSNIIREAFAMLERDTMTLLDTVDRIFIAALHCREVDFKPTESNRISVSVDGLEHFEVRLPHDTLSMFRSILARVGAICGYAEGTLEGKGELKRKAIEYMKVAMQAQQGAPLYLAYADLTVRTKESQWMLRVEMSNQNSQPLFLKISRPK